MKVRFTPTGDRQFLDVIAYILADRPAAARRFYERAVKILSRLEKFPESGRRIPEFRGLPYREVIVSPYRFFYRVEGTTVGCVPQAVEIRSGDPIGAPGYAASCRVVSVIV